LSRPSFHAGAAMPPVSRWVAASTAADQRRADRAPVATNDEHARVDATAPASGPADAEPAVSAPVRRRGTLARLLLGSGSGASP